MLYLKEKIPEAKLYKVYDSFREFIFEGKKSVHPDTIENNPDETIFVFAPGAACAALELQKNKHLENRFVISRAMKEIALNSMNNFEENDEKKNICFDSLL